MRRMKWNEYIEAVNEERKELEKIVKKAKKKKGESVDYAYVHQAENMIELYGKFEMNNIELYYEIENVEVEQEYDLTDEEYKKAFKEIDKNKITNIIYSNDNETVKFIENLEIKHVKMRGLGEIYKVFVLSEAAEKWGITEGAIRKAIQANKFKAFDEYRKAGRITLVTENGMNRVFGEK